MDQNAHGMDWFNMFNGNRWTIDGNHRFFPRWTQMGLKLWRLNGYEWMGFRKNGDFRPPKIHLESLIGGAIHLQNMQPLFGIAIPNMLEKCWKIRWLKSRTKSTQIWVKLIFQHISTYFNIFQHISTQNVVITQHVWMKLLLSPKRQWRIQPTMILIGQRNLNKIGFTFTPAGQWTRKDFWRIYALHWDCFEF